MVCIAFEKKVLLKVLPQSVERVIKANQIRGPQKDENERREERSKVPHRLIGFRNYQLIQDYMAERRGRGAALSAGLTKISIISFVVILTLQILARNYRASA